MKTLAKIQLMLSNIRFRWFVLVAVLALSLGACNWHHSNATAHHEKMIEKGVSLVSYKLDFDQQQKEILNELAAEVMLIRAETKAQYKGREADFSALLNADTLDTAKLDSLLDDHRQQFDLFFPRILPHVEKLHTTLTQKQKEKIDRGMQKRFRKHHSA